MSAVENGGIIVIPVGEVMTRRVVTVAPETARDTARRLMDEHGIRHLPVMAAGRLVGILSDRDLRSAVASGSGPLGDVMTPDPVTVTSDTRIEHVARLMLAGRFGAVPVVDGGALSGIVSYTDLLRAFVLVVETATLERIAVDFGEVRDA